MKWLKLVRKKPCNNSEKRGLSGSCIHKIQLAVGAGALSMSVDCTVPVPRRRSLFLISWQSFGRSGRALFCFEGKAQTSGADENDHTFFRHMCDMFKSDIHRNKIQVETIWLKIKNY